MPGTPDSTADGTWTQVATTSVQGLTSVAWSTPVPAGMLTSSYTYRVVAYAQDWATNRGPDATAILAGLPLTLLFLFTQRWLVSGLSAGAVKG